MNARRLSAWEIICHEPTIETARLIVPGGWLYRTIVFATSERSISLVFVPEPEFIEEIRRALQTPACDCDQADNPDPACHASDCAWRAFRRP
jgi:hypothetical protein